jgi:hypothetical protein
MLLAGVATVALAQQQLPAPQSDYLGQSPPGGEPRLFAPGLVSTGLSERDVTITPDGNEIYFGAALGRYRFTTVMVVRRVAGGWTTPEVAPFAGNPADLDLEAALSPDGKRLMFLSNRPNPPLRLERNEDIWVVDRVGGGWGPARNLGAPVNSEHKEYFPSLTRTGTLYFTREDATTGDSSIFRSRLVDGAYGVPERLPDVVNSGTARFNAFIAPDESLLLYCMIGRKDSLGGIDAYVSFRSAADAWSEPVNLGPRINTVGSEEHSLSLSPDGRFLFFMAARVADPKELFGGRLSWQGMQRLVGAPGNGSSDIWWIDASFVQALRPKVPPA